MEAHLATVWEQVADAVADRVAIVHGASRLSWREFEERAARLASVLVAHGVSAGSKVGLMLHNTPEVLESYFAVLKIRAVPFNINFRYQADEVAHLLRNAEADALVYHATYSGVVDEAADRCGQLKVLIDVRDGGEELLRAVHYEDALQEATPAPRITRSPDDITLTYTGGTTGMPKGVVGRIGPGLEAGLKIAPPLLGHPPIAAPDDLPAYAAARDGEQDWMIALPAAPLMHSTGMSLGALPALTLGGTAVLLRSRSFDPLEMWDTVTAERVNALAIVGDAFARPMVAAIPSTPWRDLQLRVLLSSGAMLSQEMKRALIDFIPSVTILDFIAATEGLMGMSVSTADSVADTASFLPADGVIVIGEDDEVIQSGSGRAGMVAIPGGEGYHDDDAAAQKTFRLIHGQRYTIPGDVATVAADGSLTLLGRGSTCINTAGEKVYPEEVEEVLKSHPAVEDVLVFGVDHERFGQQVAAVMSYSAGMTPPVDEILAAARQRLASYKLPAAVVVVEEVPRTAVGKADYRAARALLPATPAMHGASQS